MSAHRKPDIGERTRGRVRYGEAMADEYFTIMGMIEGVVVIDDQKSGERFTLTPKAALELATELRRAAKAVQ